MSDVSLALPVRLARLPELVQLSLRAHSIFFVVPLAYVLTNMVLLADVAQYKAAPWLGLAMGVLTITVPVGLVAVFLFRLFQYPTVLKPQSPVSQLAQDILSLVRNPASLLLGIPMFAAMVIFNKGMLELKPLIPAVNPFSWDVAFMELDRTLHFGADPWRILQPVLGYDVITFAINIFYNVWFLILFGMFMWFGFARNTSVNRSQFFIAYMLTWFVGGGLLAVAFSSAGPVYYSNLGLAPDPFADLMAYLRDVNTRLPIAALETQQMLWDGYTGRGPALGISAFPSMHNASTILFAMATWKRSRALGIAFATYTFFILLGSVHLGWHYAVDGYVGLALAVACWWISGFVARWHATWPSVKRLHEALAAEA